MYEKRANEYCEELPGHISVAINYKPTAVIRSVRIDKCNNSTLEDFIFSIPAKISNNESPLPKLPLPSNMSLLS